jgi:hypothetical protein
MAPFNMFSGLRGSFSSLDFNALQVLTQLVFQDDGLVNHGFFSKAFNLFLT